MHAIRVAATYTKQVTAKTVAATHFKLDNAMRVAATHPKLGNAMRVAATYPSNNMQWNEGGSHTPYTVIKEVMQVSNLRWGGGPTQPAMHW